MRLLNTDTLQLESFDGPRCPAYAILSHTWGDGEVLLQDMETGRAGRGIRGIKMKGWTKISNACRQARLNRVPYQYIWIDTCCIDKTSSAELSEAINSMFQWYQGAVVCYAYLEDVKESRQQTMLLDDALKNARWFTRGWTLQELIAPANVVFFSEDWGTIGTKHTLRHIISSITGINVDVLLKPQLLPTMSVARRMSWAAYRVTTRPEDIAYCLMGIFNVNMPLLYGEGMKAFVRLQEEIIKDSEDQSLFAWRYPRDSEIVAENKDIRDILENEGILAYHPVAFNKSSGIVSYQTDKAPYTVTNRGLQIQIPIADPFSIHPFESSSFVGILSCRYEHNLSGSIGIAFNKGPDRYYRELGSGLVFVRHETADSVETKTVHIHKWGKRPPQASSSSYCYLRRFPSGLRFSDGIATPAVASDKTWKPGDSSTKWDIGGQTVPLSATSVGHFAALKFSPQAASDRDTASPRLDGFIVVVKLISQSDGVVGLAKGSQSRDDSLLTVLKEHYKQASFIGGTFRRGNGELRVLLERTTLFDQDTFVLDIDYYPSTKRVAVNDIPAIRLVVPDN
jgi:hypothetical protein